MPRDILQFLPTALRSLCAALPEPVFAGLEELRIREGRPLEVCYGGGFAYVTERGSLTGQADQAYRPGRGDCAKLLDLLANHSVYTIEEELKRGFITIPGGHRVGLSGRVVLEEGKVKQLRDISSFNIRLAREVIGAAAGVLPHILDHRGKTVHHTLIISPPQHGKTTVVRDLARIISSGEWPASDWGPRKVGIVDERSELAGCVGGVPSFRVGPRTDVLDRCPKAEGMMMMIRSMSPEVIAVDELGRPEDMEALREAVRSGVRILATAHGESLEDILLRPTFRDICGEGIFRRFVVLRRSEQGFAAPQIHGDSGGLLPIDRTPILKKESVKAPC